MEHGEEYSRPTNLYKGPEVRISRVAEAECQRRVGQGEGREVAKQIVQGLGGHRGLWLSP